MKYIDVNVFHDMILEKTLIYEIEKLLEEVEGGFKLIFGASLS